MFLFIYLKRRQTRVNVNWYSLTSYLFTSLRRVSRDWETVKNVVPGNSSTKPDQAGGDGKGVKQSKMFNYSLYSRLGNNT